MAGNVTGDAADHRTLEAALRLGRRTGEESADSQGGREGDTIRHQSSPVGGISPVVPCQTAPRADPFRDLGRTAPRGGPSARETGDQPDEFRLTGRAGL